MRPRASIARRLRGPLAVLMLVGVASLTAPWIAPFDPARQLDITALKNTAPAWPHLLGTDPFSRDLLSRVLYGGRASLEISALATLSAVAIALGWGLVAAHVGGALGGLLMAIADAIRALPRKLLLLGAMLLLPDPSLLVLALVLGAGSWPALAPVVYHEARRVQAMDFVHAADALGVAWHRRLARHVAPHLLPVIGAASATLLADLLSVEAGLSFLGLGVRPPTASWGTILQDGLPYLGSAWWIATAPAVLLVITVHAVARVADALSDALTDPVAHAAESPRDQVTTSHIVSGSTSPHDSAITPAVESLDDSSITRSAA